MFGQQQPSFGGFGQAQSQPAFGASPASSPFGSTSAFGAQPSPFGAPAGGTGVFGQASQPAFGASSTPAFGAQQSQGGLFGGSAFGAKPAGGFSFGSAPAFGAASTPAFGSAQSSPAFGAFGATSTPAFGAAASTPAFGAAASTPSFGGFGAASTPAFGAASSSPAFGTPGSGAASPFGTPGSAFGAVPASTGFGTPAAASPGQPGSGSRVVPYQKFQDKEVGSGTTGNVQIFYNSITAMPQYITRSFEELRYEDYAAGVKNGSSAPPPAAAPGFGAGAPGTSAAAPTGFGFGAASSAAGFGASSTGSVFGQASAASPFGASSTPAFGAAASPSPFGGGFGASTPASTPAFGGFGASAPATGGGLFGAASTPAASSPFSFGGAASSGSAFGASSTPAFGAASTPAFGSTGFGAPSSGGGIFGASSTPAFGGSSPFGASSTPAFGTPTSSPFGAPAPASGGFGAPAASGGFSFNTPAAAKPAAGGFSFGSGAGGFGAASTGSLFGASNTPAFGASAGGLFGSTPANTGGSLFGGSAFGAAPATGGGLFGAASTPAAGGSAFSFAPQAGTPGAFGAAGAAPVQPPGVAQQPYGALQPLPQVNVPEQVPVSQRLVRPSVTTTRPSMRLTPRTAMPKFGLGASAGMGRGAAAGKNAAVNSAYVLSGSPGSTDNRTGSPAAAMLLPARDNPHRLFIRSPPPSTAAAANGSSLSPARGQAGVDDNAHTPVRTPQQARVPRSAERQQDAPASNGLTHTHHPGSGDKGAREDASPAAAAAAANGSGGSPSDGEEGGLVPRLGQLREEGYSMRPTERELQALAARDSSALHAVRLMVERQGYGRLTWLQPVDVAGLDLQDIVQIDRGAVAVYYEEHVQKPPIGSGLNKPCRVVLTGVHKKNKPQSDPAVVAAFSSKLKRYCSDMGAKFVSYEPAEGLWTFEVEHFSRYAVPMDSDGDDDVDEEGGGQELDEGPMQVEGSGSGAQGTASQEQEATLGFGSRPTDADMQAEADDADTQQQQQQQQFEEPPLQHMLPGLLGHDAGALLEQKGAFFRRGGAAAGSDFEFAAASRRVVDLTDRTRAAAAAPPSNAFARAYGRQADAGGGGRYGGRPGSAYDASIQQQQQDGRGGEFFAAGQGQQQQQSLEHSWERRRPALLQPAQQQQQGPRQQQRALVSLGEDQQQQQQQGDAPRSAGRLAGAAAGSALLVRPLSPQELQVQLGKDRAAGGGLAQQQQQQQARGAAVAPLLPAAAAISSSGAAVDAALMLGRSFRVGWGPTGQLVVPCNPRLNSSSGSSSSSRAAGQQQQQQSLLPIVELRQLQPLAAAALPGPTSSSSSGGSSGSSAAVVAGMQRRVLSGLQLHLDHSQPAERAAAAAAAPWQLVCDSEVVVQYVSDQLAAINTGASVAAAAAAAAAGGGAAEAAADAAGCTDHVRQLWLLLQLLFQYIEGQDDDVYDSTAAAAAGAAANGVAAAAAAAAGVDADADMGEEGVSVVSGGGLGLGLEMEELGPLTGKQYALAAMQRKAALSKWLQQKLRPQVLDALSTLLADSRSHSQQQQREDVLWGVLHLVAGRQLKAAAALAASVGDVRLSSLLACVSSAARGRHGQQLLAQVNVWRATSILPNHVRLPRRLLLAVLTAAAGGGEAGATEAALVGVASALGLDWGGALGLWMWYKVPCVESLSITVSAFTTALATREQLARPVPPYASDPAVLLQPAEAAQHPAFADSSSSSSGRGQGGAAAAEEAEEDAVTGKAATAAVVEGEVAAVADSQYALLQLHARGCRNLGTGMLNTAEGEYADVDVDTLVARLLRPAGHTPNPLDYSTAWQLLQVLKALGKLPDDDAEYEVTSSAVASSLIAQLLLLGSEAVPWAAFVALHITHGACREAALQQLLQVTAPTWACDASAVGWLRDALALPPSWLHTAQAVWYTSNHRTALAVLHMVAAGSWQEAHRLACTELLPMLALATIPAGGFSRGSNASSKAGAGSSSSSGGIAGQVLAVLSDFRAAAAAFLATVSADVAVEAEQQAAAGLWRGAEDADDASLAAADGFGGNSRAQAYCASAAAYVAAACSGAAGGPAEAAGVTLRALCGVLGQQERSLGSGWSLGGGVYASWCGAMLGRSGAFVDPAAAVADGAAEAAAAAGGGDGDGVSGEAVLQELHASTQRCLWLADLLADAASAVRTTGGKGSWWGMPGAQLMLGGMTATVGRALVRLGVASSKVAAAGVPAAVGWRMGDGAGGRGLMMMGGDQAAGQMLAAAAAVSM